MPHHLLCSYFETSAAINGLDIVGLEKKRPSLLEACDLFAIPHMPTDTRHMRDLILSKSEYNEDEWREIDDYIRDDVLLTIPLLTDFAPTIDVPRGVVPRSLCQGGRRHGAARNPDQYRYAHELATELAGAADALHPARRSFRPLRRMDHSRRIGSKLWLRPRVGLATD